MSKGKVFRIDDYRKHLVINEGIIGNSDVHVLPLSVIEDFIEGRLQYAEIDGFEVIVKCILQEWLNGL